MRNNEYRLKFYVSSQNRRSGSFATLAAALAAISAAGGLSATNKALIIVEDAISEPAQVTWLNNVDLYVEAGASVTWTNTSCIATGAIAATFSSANPLLPALILNQTVVGSQRIFDVADVSGINLRNLGAKINVPAVGANPAILITSAVASSNLNFIEGCIFDADAGRNPATGGIGSVWGNSVTGTVGVRDSIFKGGFGVNHQNGGTFIADNCIFELDGPQAGDVSNKMAFNAGVAAATVRMTGCRLTNRSAATGTNHTAVGIQSGGSYVFLSCVIEATAGAHAIRRQSGVLMGATVRIANCSISAAAGGNAFSVNAGAAETGSLVHNNTIEGTIASWTFPAQVLVGSNIDA